MLELQRNAHCFAFQRDPEKGYHWNDPSQHLHALHVFGVNNQGIRVQHSSFSDTDFELVNIGCENPC